jgi:hypothetical protein
VTEWGCEDILEDYLSICPEAVDCSICENEGLIEWRCVVPVVVAQMVVAQMVVIPVVVKPLKNVRKDIVLMANI